MKNKIIYISLVCALILIGGLMRFLTSDWLINKTSTATRPFMDSTLGKKITWDYKGQYEDDVLRALVCLRRVDEDVFDLARTYLGSREEIAVIQFLNKKDFELVKVELYANDFKRDTTSYGRYCTSINVPIEKKKLKKIKTLNLLYREALDKSFKDLW